MRLDNSIKNLKLGVLFKSFGMILHLVTRIVFIRYLSIDYLGVNGLFSNILGIISFAELGIGVAFTYSLYKPLEENDHDKISVLIKTFKKVYLMIAGFMLGAGLCMLPFLDVLTNYSTMDNLEFIYIMLLLSNVVTYFSADKQALFLADQKQYVVAYKTIVCQTIQAVVQILIIVLTRNYILYIFAYFCEQILLNIMLTKASRRYYPYLNMKIDGKLSADDIKSFKRNIKATVLHKVGNTIVNYTDNILISSNLGLAITGITSNYILVLNYAQMYISQISTSTIAGIGSLNASNATDEHKYEVFKRIDFFNFSAFYFCTVGLFAVLSPLISLMGKNLTLAESSVFIIVLNFYITGARLIVNSYKESCGVLSEDRYKAVIGAIVNLVVSIILTKKIGLLGVYIGTLTYQLGVCAWWEQKVLFDKVFSKNFVSYHMRWLGKCLLVCGVMYVVHMIKQYITFNPLINFIACGLISVIVAAIPYLILYHNNKEFLYFVNYFKKLVNK